MTDAFAQLGVRCSFDPAGPLEATNIYRTTGLLQEIAETVYGIEGAPVAFASSRPAGPALGHYWSGLARWAAETSCSEAFDEPVVRTDLTRRLAVGMLECFPLTWDRELRSLSMAAQSRRYRSAVAYFDDNAQRPITVEDAAQAADTTTALVRALRAQHPLGPTPAAYLRRVRLAGAGPRSTISALMTMLVLKTRICCPETTPLPRHLVCPAARGDGPAGERPEAPREARALVAGARGASTRHPASRGRRRQACRR